MDWSKLWSSGGYFVNSDGLHPFSGDAVTFCHSHTGIGVEHSRATAAAPGEKTEEMVFAERTGAGGGIGSRLAVWHTTIQVLHLHPPVTRFSMPIGMVDLQAPQSDVDLSILVG